MKKHSIKHTRLNGEVQKELSNIIRNEVKDPRVGMMTSVTAVDCATDLKTCKVYISVLGSEEELSGTVDALKRAEGFIRSRLARNLNLRNTPVLTFFADNSIGYGVKMSEMIDQVIGADEAAAALRPKEEETYDDQA